MRAYEDERRELREESVARTDITPKRHGGLSGMFRERTAYWVITSERRGTVEAMTVSIPGGEALPVFSLKEEAESFLASRTGSGWRLEEAGAGKLVSLLTESCAEAGRVVLDPPPDAADEAMLGLLSVGREIFLESLLGRGRAWFENGRIPGAGRERPR